MRTLNMFDKVVLAMLAVVAIMLVPEFAWAGAKGDVKWINEVIDLILKHLAEFAEAWLLPQKDSTLMMIVSIAAIALSTIGILVLQPIRKLASRAGGFPLALMAAGLVFPLLWKVASFVMGKVSTLVLILIIIGLIIGGVGGLVAIAKMILGIYKKLLDYAVDKAKKEDAGWALAVAGSICIAGFLNSSTVSSEESYYAGTWVSVITGLVMVFIRVRRTGKYQESAEIREIRRKLKGHENCIVIPDNTPDNPYDNQVLCIAKHYTKNKNGDFKLNPDGSKKQVECNTVNSQDRQMCKECDTPFNNIPWKCPRCGTDNTPERRMCSKADCQEPKPVPKRPKSCTSIVPKGYVAPDDSDSDSDSDSGAGGIRCQCGEISPPDSKRCGGCGHKFETTSPKPEPEPEPEDYDFSGGGYDPDDLDDD